MADVQEPRNSLGQTYDEWIQAQTQGQQDQEFETNLEPWDLIIGMDRAKAIPGIRISEVGAIVGRVTRPFTPAMQAYSQQAANQYGTTFQGMSYGSKTFQIPLTIMAKSADELNERLRDLANIVVTPDSHRETSIVFGEEPDIVYYGHFEAVSDPQPLNETAWDSSVTLSFVASDPRGFFNSENESVDLSSGDVSFTPEGTAFADPIITIEPKKGAKPLTQFGYTINDNEKVIVGASGNTLKMFDDKPVIFMDKMNSLNNWEQIIPSLSNPSSVIGWELARKAVLTDGIMKINPAYGASVVTNRIDGTNKNSWTSKPEKIKPNQFYGPMMWSKTNWASTIGDGNNWEIMFKLHNIKYYSRAQQGIEFYLMDKSNKRRARFLIRSNDNGKRSYSSLRFGRNWGDETRSVKTGLGYAWDFGLKSDFVDKKDVTVSVPRGQTVTTQHPYMSSKTYKQYNYYSFSGNTRTKEYWTTTEETTYNPKTKKHTTKISYSPISVSVDKNWQNGHSHAERFTASKNNNFKSITPWGSMQKLQPGTKQYWKKGQAKHRHDNPDEPVTKGKYGNNSTVKKVIRKNTTDITITQTYYNSKGGSSESKTNLKYYNGNGSRKTVGGKKYMNNFGVLATANFSRKTVSGGSNQSTQKQMIDYPDKRMAGSYDDAFLLVHIGRDDKGFYWQVQETDVDGTSKVNTLVPKTYDKRKDLHGSYDFTIDKVAIHFFKNHLPEDGNAWKEGDEVGENNSKYRPVKSYTDNYLSVLDVKVTKLLKKPNAIDLINLKPGQKAQFDTASNLFTIDGSKRQDLINLDSTWPQIRGGHPTRVRITPNPGKDYVIKMEYRPTIL